MRRKKIDTTGLEINIIGLLYWNMDNALNNPTRIKPFNVVSWTKKKRKFFVRIGPY